VAYSDDSQGRATQQIAYKWMGADGKIGPKFPVGNASSSFTGPRVITGANDVIHIFYADEREQHLYWAKIVENEPLTAPVRIDTSGTSMVDVPHSNPVVYDDNGVETIVIAFAANDDHLKSITIRDGKVGAEEALSSSTVLQNAEIVNNEGAVAHLSLDGREVHAVWATNDEGDLVHRLRPAGGQWQKENLLWDSKEEGALYVYCQVFRNENCPRLGCTYDSGPHPDDKGNIVYNEYPLTAITGALK